MTPCPLEEPDIPTILIVDDNPATLYVKTRLFSRLGYRVLEASTGTEALMLATVELPAVVILDGTLPDLNGVEICRQLKTQPETKFLKVVQTSAVRIDALDRAREPDFGADAYLIEPVEEEALISIVRALFKLAQHERDRQRLTDKLTSTQHRLLEATKAGRFGIWDWNITTGTLEWFGAHEELAGMRPGGFSEKIQTFTDILHPEDRARVWHKLQDLMTRQKADYADDYRFIHPDGSVHWMSGTGRLYYDEQGQAIRMTGVVQDISERKQAEEQLQQRNRQLELLALSSQRLLLGAESEQDLLEPIFMDIARLIEMEMFYHYRPSEVPRMLRLHTSGGITEKERTQFATMGFGELLCGRVAEWRERVIVEDLQHSSRPGSDVLKAAGATSYAGFPLVANGELVGTIAFISNGRRHLRDGDVQMIQTICDQIATALERTKLQRELRESEERYRATVANAAVGIGRVAFPNATWIDVNEALCRLVGYSREEMLQIPWPDITYPDDLDLDLVPFRLMAAGGLDTYTVEKRFIHKEGHCVWARLTLSLVRDAEGHPLYEICIAEDIKERKWAEQILMDTQERLERWNQELEQAIHEKTAELQQSQARLRSLASQLTLTEQRERKRFATELHDHLQQMLVVGKLAVGQGQRRVRGMPECEAVFKKVDEILSEALIYSRTLVAELSPPVLREHGLAASLQWLATSLKHKHGLIVMVRVPEDAPIILSENLNLLIFQSVRELLINSAKHAGTGEATVTLEDPQGHLSITVSDRGQGFDLAAAAAAAAAAGTAGGGISSQFGLFSIQERMRALGGTFDIQSAPGQGTIARLTLPFGDAATDDTRESTGLKSDLSVSEDSALSPPSSSLSQDAKIHVLLVDDHKLIRQGLRAMLDGYEEMELVGEAANGEEAVRLVEELHPAVVVMDINMPKMDGIEATRRITSRHPHIAVIGLSVNAGVENQEAMSRAGAVRLMTKESAMEDLYGVIHEAVKRRRLRRE